MAIKYVRVFKGGDDQWYFETKAANHETLAVSEGYTRRHDAVRAASDSHPGLRVTVDAPGGIIDYQPEETS